MSNRVHTSDSLIYSPGSQVVTRKPVLNSNSSPTGRTFPIEPPATQPSTTCLSE
jgi:hypothetical protein